MGNFHILKPAFKVNRNKEVSILCNLVGILKQCYIYTNSVIQITEQNESVVKTESLYFIAVLQRAFSFPSSLFLLWYFSVWTWPGWLCPEEIQFQQIGVHRTKTFFFFHHNKYQELTLNGGTLSPSITFQNTEDTFNMK